MEALSKKRFKIKLKWVLVGILALLIIFRLFLPYIVLRYVNNKLNQMGQYYGYVKDIDIALIRGAYVIKGMKILKINEEKKARDTIPFFSGPKLDLSVQWRALFKGALVGEIYADDPIVNFVKGAYKNEDLKKDTTDFRKLLRALMPLTVNHFEVMNGEIHYIDVYSSPKVNIALNRVFISAVNISNVNDSTKLLPASLKAYGRAYEGSFKMDVNFNAFAGTPTFDLNAELLNLNLVRINNLFEAYGKFDVERGNFSIYTEFAAKKGEFGGYIKPLIKDIKVKQGEGNLKDRIWEILMEGVALILRNSQTKDVGTKINIEGRFDDPNVNIWRAVSFLLRNAFVQALKPSIDNSINIQNIEDDKKKTLLEKIFGKKKEKKK